MNESKEKQPGLIARAIAKLHGTTVKVEPVEDESEVEARERIHSAGEMTLPPLKEPGDGRWGYGLGDNGGDPGIAMVGEHAAIIRAIGRFGLHGRARPVSENPPKPDTKPEDDAKKPE